MALTRDRETNKLFDVTYDTHPLAAATKIFVGAQVALNTSGYLVPASADPTLLVIGAAKEYADNSSGAAGDKSVQVDYGAFLWGNSDSADEITRLHIGREVYAVDDETVALTNNNGARPLAGRVVRIDPLTDCPFVLQGPQWAMPAAFAEDFVGLREVDADGALTLNGTDQEVILLGSTTGTKAATVTAMRNGQRAIVQLLARSGGSYTIPATLGVTAGTVTLDAAGEGVALYKTGGTLKVSRLIGGSTHA